MSQNIMNEEIKHVDLNDSSVFDESVNTMWEIQHMQEELEHAKIMYDVDQLIDDYTKYMSKLKNPSYRFRIMFPL